MRGATPPLPQYVFMAWCSVQAQGRLTRTELTPPYKSIRTVFSAVRPLNTGITGWTVRMKFERTSTKMKGIKGKCIG
jgi:hypothetical protein